MGFLSEEIDGGGAAPAAAPGGGGWLSNEIEAVGPNGVPRITVRPAPKYGAVESVVQGAQKGVAAGFNDELGGVQAASGLPASMATPDNPVGPLAVHAVGAARLAYEHLTGQRGPATQAYEEARDKIRTQQAQMQSEHPVAFGTGELGGAAGAMLAAPEEAAIGIIPRMWQGAKIGAAYGAAQGAGDNEGGFQDRAIGAAEGLGAGAVGGAAGAGLGMGLEKGAKIAYDYLGRPIVSVVRGLINPEQEAMRRGAGALARDYPQIAKGQAQGLTPAEYVAAHFGGEPTMLADMGGETTRALLRSAANTSPEGRNLINTAVQNRFATQNERVAGDLRNLVSGGADALKTREQLVADYNAARVPAYKKAFSQPGAQSVWNDEFEQIAQAPAVQDAIRGAMVSARDEAAKMGLNPPRNPFVADRNGRLALGQNADGSQLKPNLQFWDAVKKNLDAIGSRESKFWAKTLRGKLDEIVPEYGEARGIAAKFFGGDNALEAGENAIKFKGDPRVITQQLAKMSPEEQALFREGYASAKSNDVLNANDNRDVTKILYNNPNERARMAAVFGEDNLGKLEARLRFERIADLARTALGNSTTARQIVEAGLAGGAIGGYLHGWQGALEGGVAAAAAAKGGGINIARVGAQKIIGYVDGKTAAKVAEFLTSSDPKLVQRGLDIASKNSRVAQGLKAIESQLLKTVGTRQAQGMTSLAPAAANEDQQK